MRKVLASDRARPARFLRLGAADVVAGLRGEFVVLDAVDERRPGGSADDEGDAIQVVAVPHRDSAGVVW